MNFNKNHNFVAVGSSRSNTSIMGVFPSSSDTIFRCRNCRLEVAGYLNTSIENLRAKNWPTNCDEGLIYKVMES